MNRLTENKIILIKRKTRLEEMVVRYNTIEQAKFFVEHNGCDFADYQIEDEQYKKTVLLAVSQMEKLAKVQIVDREFLSNFIFGENDLVVVVGQDGLVANTLKYLSTQLLIGVNPDMTRWEGVLLPFKVEDLHLIVQDVFKMRRSIKEVTMAKAILNNGQTLYGVNDIFIGQKTHVSSKYQIRLGETQEQQSSSGIIISTGLGSTGWLKSIITGAAQIAGDISGQKIDISQKSNMDWNSNQLLFSVREPYPSKITQTELVFGKITSECPLVIRSLMPENGVIFSDGIENDYLQFNSGIEVTISIAEKKGHLVV